jgi:hypothetical protein
MSNPPHLTLDEEAFWQPSDLLSEAPELPPGTQSALERLGPSPFPKSGFPFLGFLATVYDHIASHVGGQMEAASPAAAAPEGRETKTESF